MSPAETPLDPPAYVGSWTVAELLLSQRSWGRAKCGKFLVLNGPTELELIRELTVRQRCVLARQLR